jgi:parvulin-like peptidyl-prolyl isomerase
MKIETSNTHRRILTGSLCIVSAAAAVLLIGGCSKKRPQVLASVGSEKITMEEFQTELQKMPEYLSEYLSTENGKKQYLDSLVKEKLVFLAAKKEGIKNRPEVKKKLALLEQRIMEEKKKYEEEILVDEILKEKVVLGDSDVKNYYERHKDEFEKPTEIKVSHILTGTEDEAKRVLERVKKGEDFSKLAREFSTDKVTSQKGGDLGFFGKRQYVKEFEDAAYKLVKIGDVSEVIKTPLGYHVIKLTGRKQLEARKMDDPDVQKEITQILQKEKLDKWLESLNGKYSVKTNYDLLTNKAGEKKGEKK